MFSRRDDWSLKEKKKKKKKKKNIVLRLQSLSRRYSASFCLTRIA